MRLAWATDVHLEFLRHDEVVAFCDELERLDPDAVLLTGDISTSRALEGHLRVLENCLARPIYFVLGNHDCYHGSIAATRELARERTRTSAFLRWLPACGPVPLAPGTLLVGHDGWADGRFGNYAESQVELNDYQCIAELENLSRAERLSRLHALGDEAAAWVRAHLPSALARATRVVFATHVPPFREACWHEGRISDDAWLPHFACRAVGEALIEGLLPYPDRQMTVLCGHTHSPGATRPLPNPFVRTGSARYGRPAIQDVIEID